MGLICVHGAQVVITPTPPVVFTKLADSIPGGKQQKIKIGGKPVLIQADLDAWAKTYMTNYINGSFSIPGMSAGKTAVAANFTVKSSVSGSPLIKMDSQVTLTISVNAPAQMPAPPGPNIPDPVPIQIATVKFVNSGQFKYQSL